MSWKEKSRTYFRQFRVKLRCRQTTCHRNITPCKEPVSEASRWGAPPPRVLCEEPWRSWLPSPLIYPPRGSRTETRHLIHALEELAVSECRRLTIDLNSANERLLYRHAPLY
ncbi:hypothetical protein PDIG_65950 [Penicillium digitatum PHI26]|uniref:Uncharacterized protein n=2 Tax=Penicillium digitatum TaxID=36651 RepID=K9G636_PEND2|nr:hypothetical protein PDIP_75260 [Penicillium digitatum Pd1]EKV07074.1 hypothetical protein PDIP_75260 [Penicillium digitatum Pd1]EKV08731.1 hypothetical protein PDIG_65950 [Penicillium digitatum PHI26]